VTRIFLIAESGQVRERLEELLQATDSAIIGHADDLETFDEELAHEAEIVLVNATVEPREDLLDALQDTGLLRESRVVLLTDRAASDWLNRALRAGVRGILPPEPEAEIFAAGLEAVARGLIVIHPNELHTSRAAGNSAFDTTTEFVEPLTTREREVLQMLSEGLGNKEIAGRLKISEHTVKFHVASILGKLGASTRTEAVSIALRRGMVLL
jgi:two-component system, NarL family, response regulator YdfI